MSDVSLNPSSSTQQHGALSAKHAVDAPHGVRNQYQVICRDKDGNIKWTEDFHNLVTLAGLSKFLDATLKTGLSTPAWYIGLITGPGASNTYAQSDVMTSHAGWSESTGYSNATRPVWTPGSITNPGGSEAYVDNSASAAVFNINASVTVAGCFMVSDSTKGGTAGTLLGEGNFSIDRPMISGDTLTVTMSSTQF